MKKRVFAAAMAVVMACSLAGCGSSGNGKPAGAGGSGAGAAEAGASAQAGTAGGSGAKSQEIERKEYTVVYSAELAHINYLKSSLSTCTRFTENYVDALVDFDKYGVMTPCLATDWEISEDQLTYTFHLREGVNWYTSEGDVYAPVVAQDFVDAAKWLLTKDNASTTANIFYNVINNAEAYFNGEITDFNEVGVKAVDEHTLQYTLTRPTPYFLSMTAYVCFLPANGKFLEECGEAFGTGAETMLSNGAYILTSFEPESKRVLEMNENYWDKDNIFISRINYSYNKEAKTLAPELFLRGEVSEADIPAEILDEWMNDEERKNMMVIKPASTTSNFLGFNFEPLYEEEYGPDNWLKAVNNENFRKSIYYALDREAAVMTSYPYGYEDQLLNTVTTKNFVNVNGVDYTELEPLKEITNTEQFQKDTALEYKAKAVEELTGTVDFPVIVVMPYSTGNLGLTNRVQVEKQQLENLLGSDYISVELVPYPPTNYLKESRSSGKFSLMEMGWGPDYSDPAGYVEVMTHDTSIGTKYSRPYLAEDLKDAAGNSIYENMANAAREETADVNKRYELFAEAEQYLIENALVIPLYASGGGYRATYMDPFSGRCTQFGRNLDKYKGARVLDKPMTEAEYKEAEAAYLAEREEALKKAAE